MTDAIRLDIQDGIGTITFNRPEALNTFDFGMLDGLGAAYQQCDADDDVRVVIITGAGRAFCAGADLSRGDAFDKLEDMEFSSCPLSMNAWDVRKPVIAAVNGHAIGVGLSIAAQADLRIFAAEAKVGFLQNRRGVIADFGIEYLLPKLIGFERAFEMVVGAVRISGEQAGEWGLASRVVPAANVLPTALEIARDWAENCSPLVMGMHKRLLWRGLDMSREAFIDAETRALHYTMGRPDALEGGMAFFEKRAPRWKSSVNQDWPDWLD